MIAFQHVTDGYKLGHSGQYVPKTEMVYATLTPRSHKLARYVQANFSGKMVYAGGQYAVKLLKEGWQHTFFDVPKEKAVKAYTRRLKNYLGPDHGDQQIELMGKLHDLGYLPLEIKSLPEGVRVNMQIPVMSVKSTHKDFYWLTNYVETFLSCTIWPICNAASISEQYYLTSKRWGEITGAPDMWLGIANHCFAARGHRGMEDAMISGFGHLLFSYGSDTLWSIDFAEEYYNADSDKELIACSVNATEHATATQRIAYYRQQGHQGLDAEVESLRDLLTNVYPTGIISYVSDSEDYYGLLEYGLPVLRDVILSREEDSLGLCKFVVRPDSSPKTPLEVICGDPDAPEGSAERKGSVQLLADTFGFSVNEKGFKVLHPKVGLIYGEAIDIDLQDKIYATLHEQGWCVSNVLFGVGSWGFLDRSSRDSWSMAIKGTHSIVAGKDVSMQKTPKTAANSKKSAKGLLRVELEGDSYVLYQEQSEREEKKGELEAIFYNGDVVNETSLAEIRSRTMV